MGNAARAAGKVGISVSSVASDARERVSQLTTSGGEEGKHLFGMSLGTMDTEMIPAVASGAPESRSRLLALHYRVFLDHQ